VMDMLYRFAASGSAMSSGAASELFISRGTLRRRAVLLDPCGALDEMEPSAWGSRRKRYSGAEKRRRTFYDPTTASDLQGGSFVSSASGADVRPPASSADLSPGTVEGAAEDDAEARAATTAAAVVDGATADEGEDNDDSADAFIRAVVAGRTPIPPAANGAVSARAEAAARAAKDPVGRRTSSDNNESSYAAGSAAAACTAALTAAAAARG